MTGGLNSNNSVCHSGSHDKLQESFGGLQAHREVAAHVLDVLLSCINRGIQSKGGEGLGFPYPDVPTQRGSLLSPSVTFSCL